MYGLIQGPEFGWTDPLVLAAFAVTVLAITGWVRFELAQNDPLLDPRLFRIGEFRMGSFTVTTAFLVMFGMFFVLTQYLQFAAGYSPLEAAVRTLPFAICMVVVAPRAPALTERIGARRTISTGLAVASTGFIGFGFLAVDTPYALVALCIVLIAAGMALTFPTATEAIVSSLPENKAGVASAMNDTTREIGGAIGIALLGSLLSSGYRSGLGDAAAGLAPEAAHQAEDSIGAALHIAAQSPVGESLAMAARNAFMDGMQLSMWTGAGLLILGALTVAKLYPDT